MVAWPASRPALVGGQVGGPGGRAVPHHAFGFPTMYLSQRYQVLGIIQALRKEMKASEKTHARAVRKLPINSWEQGPA